MQINSLINLKKYSVTFKTVFKVVFSSFFTLILSLPNTTLASAPAGTNTIFAVPSFNNLQSYLNYSSFYLSSEQYQEFITYFDKNKIALDSTTPELRINGKTLSIGDSGMQAEIVDNGIQVNGYTWNLKKFSNIETALDDLSRHLRQSNKKVSKLTLAFGPIAYASDNSSIDRSYRIGAGLLAVAGAALMAPVGIPAAIAYALVAAGGVAVINGLIESTKLHFSQLQCRGEEIVLHLPKAGKSQETLILRKDLIYVKNTQATGEGYAGKFNDPKITAELQRACSDEKYKSALLQNLNSIHIPPQLLATPGSIKISPRKLDPPNNTGTH